jgi:hypothetical protein
LEGWKVGRLEIRLETRLPRLGIRIEGRKATTLGNKFLD